VRQVGGVFLAPGVVVTGDVTLAEGVNVWYGSVLRGDVAAITVGAGANLQDGVIVHCDHGCPQEIGPGVVAGHAAVLHGRRVGADTLVGIGARLLSGSDVGPGCVIAAGAVVTGGKVPPHSLVMGVPGRVVRLVTDEELERTKVIAARYLQLARRYAAGEFPHPYG
jgi:carbonic anhydrase/acetyltransferase-like protein (isoleucine patch superfamily)